MLAVEARTRIEAHAVEHAIERMTQRYLGRHDPDFVRRTALEVYRAYSEAHVQAFVPVLVERDTRRLLDALAGGAVR